MRKPNIGDMVKAYYRQEEQFGFISFIGPEGKGIQITLFNHPTPLLYTIEERNYFWAFVD